MGNIILLFCIELLFLCIVYVISNGNILSPAFVSYALFSFATVCVLYNTDFWRVSFSGRTVFIVSLGFLAMLVPELYYSLFGSKNGFHNSYSINNNKEMNVNWIINSVVSIVCIILVVIQIWRVFTEGNYRQYGLYAIGLVKYSDESFDSIVRMCVRVNQVLGTIYMYICINNVVRLNKDIKSIIRYIIPIVSYCISMFFCGNRLGFIKVLAAFFVIYVVMKGEITKKGKVRLIDIIKPVLLVGIIVIVGFFSLRGYSKINSSAASRSFKEYMTYYIGSPIYLFDKYLINPKSIHSENEVFGQMTLTSFYTVFGKNINYFNKATLVGGNAFFAGNEYSWFQRPIADYGIIGMIMFTILIYWIFDYILYRKIYQEHNKRKRNAALVIYAFFFYIPVMSFYYCQVCNAFSIFNIIALITIIWGVNHLCEKKIGSKRVVFKLNVRNRYKKVF